MPIYEYRCAECGRRSSLLFLSIAAAADARCPHCGGARMRKLVSRVAVMRSEESRLEGLADPSRLSGLDENDPASVARWVKKMGREMGEELGDDFEEEVDRAAEEAAASGGEGGEDGGPEGTGGAWDE
jgi:putative FmdB family regulatory protein